MRRSIEFIERLARRGLLPPYSEGPVIAEFLQSGSGDIADWLRQSGHVHPDAVRSVSEAFDGSLFVCAACHRSAIGAQLRNEIATCPACGSPALERNPQEAIESGEIDLSLLDAIRSSDQLDVSAIAVPDAIAEPAPVPPSAPASAEPERVTDAVPVVTPAPAPGSERRPAVRRESDGPPAPVPDVDRDTTAVRLARTDHRAGEVIAGQWKLVRLVESTSAVERWEAFHESLQRRADVRLLRRAGKGLQERLARGARACAKIQHPAVLKVYDCLEHNGTMCLATEWVEGVTADELLRRHSVLPAGLVVRIACDVAEGLAAAHAVGVLHRDLRPSCITVGTDRVCINDFGMASLEGDQNRLTAPGSVLGVPPYTAPELLAGEPASNRTDAYSLAAVLFHLLTGTQPAGNALPAPGDRRAELPVALNDLVVAMGARNPRERMPLENAISTLRALRDQLRDEADGGFAPSLDNDVYLITMSARFGNRELSSLGEFIEAAAKSPPVRLILDLSDCHSASGSVLDRLAGMGEQLGDGDRILCTGAPQRLRIAIEMMGLTDRFEIHDDLATALKALGGGNLVWSTVGD